MDDGYMAMGALFGVPVFFGTWIYCALNYGLLFGVGLGWLPAMVLAAVATVVWPLILLGVAGVALLVFTA